MTDRLIRKLLPYETPARVWGCSNVIGRSLLYANRALKVKIKLTNKPRQYQVSQMINSQAS